jgi:hypothetical protein
MSATAAQVFQYNRHKQLCGIMRIGQATLEHRTLQGTLSTPSSTGNIIYTGPGPSTTDLIVSKVKIWLVTEPLIIRGGSSQGDDLRIGRQGVPMMHGQCPAIDDYGKLIVIADDDLLVTQDGSKMKLENPSQTPDVSMFVFNLVKLR